MSKVPHTEKVSDEQVRGGWKHVKDHLSIFNALRFGSTPLIIFFFLIRSKGFKSTIHIHPVSHLVCVSSISAASKRLYCNVAKRKTP